MDFVTSPLLATRTQMNRMHITLMPLNKMSSNVYVHYSLLSIPKCVSSMIKLVTSYITLLYSSIRWESASLTDIPTDSDI